MPGCRGQSPSEPFVLLRHIWSLLCPSCDRIGQRQCAFQLHPALPAVVRPLVSLVSVPARQPGSQQWVLTPWQLFLLLTSSISRAARVSPNPGADSTGTRTVLCAAPRSTLRPRLARVSLAVRHPSGTALYRSRWQGRSHVDRVVDRVL
jgi:hypothetical protein